ncbi:M23 family metallopeptidase [Cryobacterium soli]|uniref:M23 family metallopeptidase n=1 Tax=Cryobacterium soli TaxID=2220095 RepID=UPI0013C41BF2|nr:M23 family metallopeptidase [Cryobacterium soli]
MEQADASKTSGPTGSGPELDGRSSNDVPLIPVIERRHFMAGGAFALAMAMAGIPLALRPSPANAAAGSLYNPFDGWPIYGTWWQHGSYSAGGIDYPLPYGTSLPAPGAGTLSISGGSGEFAAGWVGSAGRRAVLRLDTPVARLISPEPYPPEGSGDLVAVVYQHMSAFSAAGHYSSGQVLGKSGASANGDDYGGDTHLHVHGLTAGGARVDFLKFVGGEIPSPGPSFTEEEGEMAQYYRNSVTGALGRFGGGVVIFGSAQVYEKHREIVTLWNQKNPNFQQPLPPSSTNAANFISLDDFGWNVQVASHGGVVYRTG